MSKLRERFDSIYASHGRLDIPNGKITLDDVGWKAIRSAVIEEIRAVENTCPKKRRDSLIRVEIQNPIWLVIEQFRQAIIKRFGG